MSLAYEQPGRQRAGRAEPSVAPGVRAEIAPAGLHALLLRLLDDHQRMISHHAHLCPLCQDTCLALELLAEQLPDDELLPGQ